MKKLSVEKAKQYVEKYLDSRPSQNELPEYIELLEYIIQETNDADYINELAGYYKGNVGDRLAKKYFEISADQGDYFAYLLLGIINYDCDYNKNDYEKAYRYFSYARDAGSIDAYNTIADMYKYGIYLPKDYNRYREIIEETYDRTLTDYVSEITYPETSIRYAEICIDDGDKYKAFQLLATSKKVLIERIKNDRWIGNVCLMKRLMDAVYRFNELDINNFDIFDLFKVFDEYNSVEFYYKNGKYKIVHDVNEKYDAYIFDNEYFSDLINLIFNGTIGIYTLGMLCEELHSWRVI